MTNPLVSVVITTFTDIVPNKEDELIHYQVDEEHAEFLEGLTEEQKDAYFAMLRPEMKLQRVLISFLEQPYEPIEIIVVDDGTPFVDGENVVEKVIDILKQQHVPPGKKIVYHRKENGGQASAFNAGTKMALGKYIMPFNDDDVVHPFFLQVAVSQLENGPDNIGYVYSDYLYTYDWEDFMIAMPQPELWDHDALRDHQICPVIGLYRAEVARKVEWDETLPHEEDWDYLLRISKHCEGLYLPDTYSFVIFKHLGTKSITESDGVEECHHIIEKRIQEGYYE